MFVILLISNNEVISVSMEDFILMLLEVEELENPEDYKIQILDFDDQSTESFTIERYIEWVNKALGPEQMMALRKEYSDDLRENAALS